MKNILFVVLCFFFNLSESFINLIFEIIENKIDQIIRMVHQVCMEVPTWVKPKVTTRMMVIKIWDVVRDSKEVVIEEVIAEAEEALKETIRTVMATKTTTSRTRCSITNSTTTMVR